MTTGPFPIPDVRSRVERAARHLSEIELVESSMVHDVVVFPRDGGRTREWRVFAHELPEDLPLTVADVVQDLRSALDFAVYHAAGGDVLVESDARGHSWPVAETRSKFRDATRKMTTTLPAVALGVIERHQPYHPQPEPTARPLAVLSQLDNTSKHRRLHVAASAIPSVGLPVGPNIVSTQGAVGGVIPPEGLVVRSVTYQFPPLDPPDPGGFRVALVLVGSDMRDGTLVELLRRCEQAVHTVLTDFYNAL